jgi:hypothetical protein
LWLSQIGPQIKHQHLGILTLRDRNSSLIQQLEGITRTQALAIDSERPPGEVHVSAPPSGEAALAALLAPGAWAREPLLPRLEGEDPAAAAAATLSPTRLASAASAASRAARITRGACRFMLPSLLQ